MAKAKPEKPVLQFPCVMYLRNGEHVSELHVIGETSRSWLTGTAWDTFKYAKCEYTPVTKEEYELNLWAHRHRYKISSMVGWNREVSDAKLKEVAELIGYESDERSSK